MILEPDLALQLPAHLTTTFAHHTKDFQLLPVLDLLCNLALRNDDLGHKVEKLLFDLFSGKRSGSPDIDKKINQA
ncbi:hypothetical protein C4723_24320, partial [Salmonella enterica subsp. enterica serovar Newport]